MIKTKQEFDRLLSPARAMGPPPRLPDFTKEAVVVVTEPETNRNVKVEFTSAVRFGRSIALRYRTNIGEETSHKSRPFAAIIVGRGDATEVLVRMEGDERALLRFPLR